MVAKVAVALLASVSGCMTLPAVTGEPDPLCHFPAETALTFAGRTTLGEMGLPADRWEFNGRTVRDVPADVYITRDPIVHHSHDDPRPQRTYCAVYRPAGLEPVGVQAAIPEQWKPPPWAGINQ